MDRVTRTSEVREIGVGTGRNLPEYPTIVRLTGVDLSPEMRDRASAAAKQVCPEVDLRGWEVKRSLRSPWP